MTVGKIQAPPRGLLQFLRMVGTGVSPIGMADEVQANLNIEKFYGTNFMAVRNASASIAAVTNGVTLTVPSREVWLVKGVSARMTGMLTTELVSILVRVVAKQGISCGIVDRGPITITAAANGAVSASRYMDDGIVLSPGESVQAIAMDLSVGAARTMTVDVLAYILQS